MTDDQFHELYRRVNAAMFDLEQAISTNIDDPDRRRAFYLRIELGQLAGQMMRNRKHV